MVPKVRFRITHLLLAAATLHAMLSLGISLAGRYKLMPSQFSESGIGAFAYDGFVYQSEITRLARQIKSDGVAAWISSPSELHLKLYSLCYGVVSSHVDFNILTIEPVNLVIYLLVILLVYEIGNNVFGRWPGLLAASVVAFWPSLLLHTTQPLKDSLVILAFLAMVFAATKLLKGGRRLRDTLLLLIYVAVAATANWIIRMASWDVARLVILLTIVALLLRQWRDKQKWSGTVMEVAALTAIIFLIPQTKTLFHNQQHSVRDVNEAIAEHVQGRDIWERIAIRRRGFAMTTVGDDGISVGSNIDTDSEFNRPMDILFYVPRAVIIGFLAPFPNMWAVKGNRVGLAGRILSGAEMVLTYIIELLAFVGLWSRRKNLVAWLLFLTAFAATVGLGLIVTNVGTLYRERYPFWVLLVMLGAGGASHLLSSESKESEMIASLKAA